MATIITRGAMSAKALGFTGQTVTPVYVEDVFSTYLYTGNGSTQTINNGIDLATKGGLVWAKCRSIGFEHALYDTARGATKRLASDTTAAQSTYTGGVTAFNTTGFSIGINSDVNFNNNTFASWTFRRQAKFFDVVTYTGDGSGIRAIAHSLGCNPGIAILKKVNTSSDWIVTDPAGAFGFYGAQPLFLNSTAAKLGFNQTGIYSANSTSFYVGATSFGSGSDFGSNDSGTTYVAYLFAASNSGGFGAAGTDSVVACGSYTGNGSASGPTVTLGWEPQYLLVKSSTSAGLDWVVVDNMRQFSQLTTATLLPNSSAAEGTFGIVSPTATGFQVSTANTNYNNSGDTYIYLAIRRGPMKTPTDATKVFEPISSNGPTGTFLTTGFPVDMFMGTATTVADTQQTFIGDRLRGLSTVPNTSSSVPNLVTSAINAEILYSNKSYGHYPTGFQKGSYANNIGSIYWNFRRAPGFMDEVCYTGTGSPTTQAHNLGVAPDMMILKERQPGGNSWVVYHTALGNTGRLILNSDSANNPSTTTFNSTSPTASVFTVGSNFGTNYSGSTYVAYLFATCPGVSKVGSYTGTGAAQNINCGFSAGARFVLIKRTDSTGDWYVYDSARGISSGNDPYLLLNSTAAEVTGTNYVDTFASGFTLTASAPAGLNANGGSYIFLAIA